jgi:hypothetical protein
VSDLRAFVYQAMKKRDMIRRLAAIAIKHNITKLSAIRTELIKAELGTVKKPLLLAREVHAEVARQCAIHQTRKDEREFELLLCRRSTKQPQTVDAVRRQLAAALFPNRMLLGAVGSGFLPILRTGLYAEPVADDGQEPSTVYFIESIVYGGRRERVGSSWRASVYDALDRTLRAAFLKGQRVVLDRQRWGVLVDGVPMSLARLVALTTNQPVETL